MTNWIYLKHIGELISQKKHCFMLDFWMFPPLPYLNVKVSATDSHQFQHSLSQKRVSSQEGHRVVGREGNVHMPWPLAIVSYRVM